MVPWSLIPVDTIKQSPATSNSDSHQSQPRPKISTSHQNHPNKTPNPKNTTRCLSEAKTSKHPYSFFKENTAHIIIQYYTYIYNYICIYVRVIYIYISKMQQILQIFSPSLPSSAGMAVWPAGQVLAQAASAYGLNAREEGQPLTALELGAGPGDLERNGEFSYMSRYGCRHYRLSIDINAKKCRCMYVM